MNDFLTVLADQSQAYKIGQIIGVILSILILIGIPTLFVISLVKTIQKRGAIWIVMLILSSVVGLVFGGLVIYGMMKGFDQAMDRAKENRGRDEIQTVVCDDGLLKLEIPGHWKEIRKLSDEASLQYGNERSSEFCIVLTELIEDFEFDSLSEYGDLVRETIEGNIEDPKVGEWTESKTKLGETIIQSEISGSSEGIKIKYILTVFRTEKHFHQLVQWTVPSSWNSARPYFDQVAISIQSVE